MTVRFSAPPRVRVQARVFSSRRVLSTAASAGAYRLRDRAQHVYQEAALVPRFRGVCNDGALDADAKLAALAELMDASHASCRCGRKLERCITTNIQ